MKPLVSTDLLAQSRKAQVANILKKQQAGKTLTAREERTLLEASTEAPPGIDNFVRTYDELAVRLSTSRRTISSVILRFKDETPLPRADGRHDVTAWLKFFADNGINGASADGAEDDRPGTIADWKMLKIEHEVERIAIQNAQLAGTLMESSEVEAGLASLLSGLRQAINNVPGRMADKVLHITDHHEAEGIIQEEMSILLKTIIKCDFLNNQ